MKKEFLPYNTVRNNSFKLASSMLKQNYVPDVIYASLRGGCCMANCISEFFKVACPQKNIIFGAVIASSYSGVQSHSSVSIQGWNPEPVSLSGKNILLVDDIFDSGQTINFLVENLISQGVPAQTVKIAVHDYKIFTYKEPHKHVPDFFCRKFVINSLEDDLWIHYSSHELVGLSLNELEEHYFAEDSSLRPVLSPFFC